MGWIAKLGKRLGITVTSDETPWCGTFCAHVMQHVGIEPPPIAVRASSWGMWGRKLIHPRPGCIVVFVRKGGGHVGFYEGEDATHIHVLGGNQSNAVNVMRLAKDRLTEMRWPDGVPLPAPRIVRRAATGQASDNEA
jgi:uncharacterized protein (TIGR02594 family)